MKKLKKSGKKLASKVLNLFIVLLMLLQPVGTPSLIVAIAADEPTAEALAIPAAAPEPKVEAPKEEAPAPGEEPKVEALAPAVIENAPEAPVVEEPVVEPIAPVITEPVIELTTPAAPAENTGTQNSSGDNDSDDNDSDSDDDSDNGDSSDSDNADAPPPATDAEATPSAETTEPEAGEGTAETGTTEETPSATTETIPAVPADPVAVSGISADSLIGAANLLVQGEPAETPVVDEKKCLASDAVVRDSSSDDWNYDAETGVAETKNNVELGVKYIFPGNDKVSVTFTCLPNTTTPLKIEQIKADDIQLPEGIIAASEYAYDITTGMEDGDFKYDLELPKSDMAGAEIKYIEQTAEEVVEDEVSTDELKAVDDDNVKEEDETVTVSKLEHFTVFLVTVNQTVSSNSVDTPDNGWISDNDYAVFDGDNDWAEYGFPDIIVPAGSVIDGIEVFVEGNATSTRDFEVALWNVSNNNPDAYTSIKTANISDSDTTQTLGSPNDKWGETWTPADFADATFKVRVAADNDGGTAYLDRVEVKVYYHKPLNWPTSWSTPNSCVADPSNDENPDEIDLIGNSGTPAVGFASDSDYQYFRERINGNPGTVSNLDQYSWVVLFQTSSPQYQYLGVISGKEGNKVLLYDNTTHAPDSGGVDFSPLFNDPADNIVWEGASSGYGRVTSSGGEYYIDWAIPLTELTSRGIDASTTKFFATSTNANNYNKDHLQCYEAFADLSIVKSDNPDPVLSGGALTYTLDIHNGGPDTASGVVVTDTLPDGYSVTSVTPIQGSCSDITAPSIQCELGNMASGADATITIVGTITGSDTVTNTASVSLDTTVSTDLNLTNNTDTEDTLINVPEYCGDGIVNQTSEQCDDGNQVDGDACNNRCQLKEMEREKVNTCTGEGELYLYKNDPFQDIDTAFTIDAGSAYDQLLIFTRSTPALMSLAVKVNGNPATISLLQDDPASDASIYGVDVAQSDLIEISGNIIDGARKVQGYLAQDKDAAPFDLTTLEFIHDSVTSDPLYLTPNEFQYVFFDKYTYNALGDANEDFRELHVEINGSSTIVDETYDHPFPSPAEGAVVDDYTVAQAGNYTLTVDTEDSIYWVLPKCEQAPVCGDGKIDENSGEQCDDGNENNNDDCTNKCEINYCLDADVVLDIDPALSVVGDGCFSPPKTTDATTVNTPVAGRHFVKGVTHRGNPDQCQTNEDYFLNINGENGPETTDDADPCAETVRLDDLGEFNFTAGNNTVTMNTAAQCPPDDEPESVAVSKLCIYYGAPAINVEKSSTTASITAAGQVVPYTFVVTNTGGQTLTGITVTDPNCDAAPAYQSGDTNIDSQLQTAEIWTYTCNHTVTQAEIDTDGGGDGDLDNTVTADSTETEPDTDDLSIPIIIPPMLTIEKFNDQWPNVQNPGDVVDYTITVRASENNVNDVVVKDLLPEGFSFQSITSVEKNGGALAVANPAYASPGTWGLGDLADGDEVVIKFKATIGGTQDPGTYKDLAWAEGTDDNQGPVLATNTEAVTRPAGNDDTGEISGTDNFVGTQIALAVSPAPVAVALEEDRETKTKTRTKRVLGAALPATGASPVGPMVALIFLIIGFNLVMEAKKRGGKNIKPLKVNAMKMLAFAILSGAMLVFGSQAMAATIPPAIRLETPPANINDPNLSLTFTALDIENRAMTIECLKKGPGEVGFSVFDTVGVAAGGNSGTCNAALAGDGTYEFYATATAGVDSDESETVFTELATGTPNTPLNYDREEHGCNVSFTTANDGLTTTVELYRSTELDFIADASTLANSIAIGPNTNGTITDPGAGCDDYYYAIRAVSAAGIGSGFVGDEKTSVRTRTRTRTITIHPEATGAIPVAGGGVAGGAAAGADGAVAGAETGEEGASVEGGAEGEEGEEGEEGRVLGEETQQAVKSFFGRAWPWLLGLIVLAVIYYGIIRKRNGGKSGNGNVE